ncbi:MAG: acyl-CoA thioesterase [Rhabdochlamydiaceae bacterium]
MSFYKYLYTIQIKDTDATGCLFFPKQQEFVLAAFESFLEIHGYNLNFFIKKSFFTFPVVKVESEYFKPLECGDKIYILLSLKEIGSTSFTSESVIKNHQDVTVGKTSITHVCVDKLSKRPIDIPLFLRDLLNKMGKSLG